MIQSAILKGHPPAERCASSPNQRLPRRDLREPAALERVAVLAALRFAERCADFFAVFFLVPGFALFLLAAGLAVFFLAGVFLLADCFFFAEDFAAFLAAGFVAFLLVTDFVAFLFVPCFASFLSAVGCAAFLFVAGFSALSATEVSGAATLPLLTAPLGVAFRAVNPPVPRSRPGAVRARAREVPLAARGGAVGIAVTSGCRSL
jgi:hypothetical protein